MNYLARALLVKSGFSGRDIILKITFSLRFTIHQYLMVSLGKRVIAPDPGGYAHGIKFGEYDSRG